MSDISEFNYWHGASLHREAQLRNGSTPCRGRLGAAWRRLAGRDE